MKTSTFIKRFASVLLVMVLMLQNFAFAQVQGPGDFYTKSKKNEKQQTVKGQKVSPKMMQMMRKVERKQAFPSATELKKVTPNKNISRAPLAVTESGATLFGNLIYSSDWEDTSQTGFYNINPNTGEYTTIATNEMLAGAGTVVDGIGYISYGESDWWGSILSLYTIVYDVENGEILDATEHDPEDYTSYAINMAYNYVDKTIYAITYNEDASLCRLSTFDRTNHTYSMIADFPAEYDIFAMTFDPNGTLYLILADGVVYEADPETGAIIGEVANTGFSPRYMQSACWSPVDNQILWAASNDDESYILAIDVATGTTETLCTFNYYEEWTSLYTTDPIAGENAPAEPLIVVTLDSPSALTGTIMAVAPTATLAGNTLSETGLSFVVELNGEEIYNAAATPGQMVTLTPTFAEGNNTVRAYAINDDGKGAIATYKLFAGEDTPKPVTNLEVSIDDSGLATLTWVAPTEGANGGYLNTASLTYTVERLGEVVATGLTNTTYTDQLPDGMAAYEWAVYAVAGEKTSAPTFTDRVIFGDAIVLPYEHAFDNEGCLDLYTVVDNNLDEKTWTFSASNTAIQYSYNSNNDADDYAMTPPLQLTNEKMINVEVTSLCYSLSYPEKIEITLGTSTDPATHTTVLIPATVVDWNAPQALSANFSVEEAGTYYIGIHAVSDADMFYLLVKDITVKEAAGFGAPKAVENVTATPGANGALTATLAFTAPTESFGGDALTEDVTVTIYRGEELIGSTTLAPGAAGSITDDNAAQGNNEYSLVTSNSEGEGDVYKISCFCGVDIPTQVTNIKFTTAEDNQSTVMSWDAPTTGAQGGYVNVEELVYTIYVPTPDGYYIEPIGETTELSYTITVEETTLTGYSYYVSAKNDAGESGAFGGSVVLGKPYALPFVEQLTSTSLANGPWYLYSEEDSYAEWGIGATMENYNLPEVVTAPDGGMMVCYDSWEYAGGSCGLKSPKMSLAGATAPTLYFSMYHYATAADDNELKISVTTNDNTYEEIFAKKVNDIDEYGWVEYQVSLDEYKDAGWIAMMFDANITPEGFVFIDYVIVENASENDVMVKSVNVPSNVVMGEEAEITASILNKGTNAASYEVTFFVGEEELTTVTGSDLANNEVAEHTAKFTPKAEHIGIVDVKAVVTMTGATDEVEANNEATAKLNVKQPELPVVIDLTGEGESTVTLTWSAPIVSAEAIVDDMEKYESFIIDNIGDYINVDGDQAETYLINGSDFPQQGGTKAWQVWAPSEASITADLWQPYSGSKCLVAWSTVTGSGPADDWLISPEIVGGTEMSFYAGVPTTQYGPETFEVLYSTTGTDISTFQPLEQSSKGTEGWEQFTYSIPAGAKHFAIRYTSTDVFALLIDDLSYVPAARAARAEDLEILGYNVYANGEKLNDELVTETTYSQGLDCIEYNFNVTVVYNEGESLFSNTFVITGVGIEDLNSIGVNVYGQDDFIKIENVAGRMVRVFTVDGRVVYNAKATDNDILIPANLGVYIVNIDNTASCKVFVR